MKKILFIFCTLFLSVALMSCKPTTDTRALPTNDNFYSFRVIEIDGCEYVQRKHQFAHKGNCKYCAERRKQELLELKYSLEYSLK